MCLSRSRTTSGGDSNGTEHSRRGRLTGTFLALTAVVCAAPEAVLLKEIRRLGAETVVILLWKQLLIGAFFALWHMWASGGSWRLPTGTAVPVMLGSVFYGLTCMQTVGCIWTSTSRAYLLFYLNPMWSSVLDLVFTGERLHCRTLVAVCLSVCAVAVAFDCVHLPWALAEGEGSRHSGHPKSSSSATLAPEARAQAGDGVGGEQHPSLLGDAVCAIAGCAFAAYLTCSRWAYRIDPTVPMRLSLAYGCFGVALCAIVTALVRGVSIIAGPPLAWALLLLDVVAIAAFCGLSTQAARFLPSAELGLVLLLDIMLAPLLSLAQTGERPSQSSLVGGAILLITLLSHEALSFVSTRQMRAPAVLPLTPLDVGSEQEQVGILLMESRDMEDA